MTGGFRTVACRTTRRVSKRNGAGCWAAVESDAPAASANASRRTLLIRGARRRQLHLDWRVRGEVQLAASAEHVGVDRARGAGDAERDAERLGHRTERGADQAEADRAAERAA